MFHFSQNLKMVNRSLNIVTYLNFEEKGQGAKFLYSIVSKDIC